MISVKYGYASALFRKLNEMKRDREFCDFTIIVKGEEFHVHKTVISTASSFFETMLRNDNKESREGKAELHDIDPDSMKCCIDFMYTGRTSFPKEKTRELLKAAKLIHLEFLLNDVECTLQRNLNPQNYFFAKEIAQSYSMNVLLETCKRHCIENVNAISNQPEFRNQNFSDVFEMLTLPCIGYEENKMIVALRWIRENPDDKARLPELVRLIKLNQVSVEFVEDLLEDYDDVMHNTPLRHLFKVRVERHREKLDKNQLPSKVIYYFIPDRDIMLNLNPATGEIGYARHTEFGQIDSSTFVIRGYHLYAFPYCQKSVYRLKFNDKSSKWEKMADMLCENDGTIKCTSLSGSLVIATSGKPETFQRFDHALNQWIMLKIRPGGGFSSTPIGVDRSLYVIGGLDQEWKYSPTFFRYDSPTSEWTQLESMNVARLRPRVVNVNQRIYVVGGGGRELKQLQTVESYDFILRQWSVLSPMNILKGEISIQHCNGWIIAGGPSSCSGLNETCFEKYDIAYDKWHEVEMPGGLPYSVDRCLTV